MKTQRMLGAFLGAFCFVTLLGRIIKHPFIAADVVVLVAGIFYFLTMFREGRVQQFFQATFIVIIGTLTTIVNNTGDFVSSFIFTCGFELFFIYGFMEKYFWVKASIYAGFQFMVYSAVATDFSMNGMLASFSYFSTAFQYVCTMHLLDKAKRLDAIELAKAKEAKEDAVEAGALLVEELKKRKGK